MSATTRFLSPTMPRSHRLAPALRLMVAAAAGIACQGQEPLGQRTSGVTGERLTAGVRTGGHVAGPADPRPVMRNPLAGDSRAEAEGRRLYAWYNCAGCHGTLGGGGMGPPLADDEWIYGSEPNNVFQSIVQGRPNGMPAYERLPDDHVWKLVLQVRELGGLPADASQGQGTPGPGSDQSDERSRSGGGMP